jgi:hypothetical protein
VSCDSVCLRHLGLHTPLVHATTVIMLRNSWRLWIQSCLAKNACLCHGLQQELKLSRSMAQVPWTDLRSKACMSDWQVKHTGLSTQQLMGSLDKHVNLSPSLDTPCRLALANFPPWIPTSSFATFAKT